MFFQIFNFLEKLLKIYNSQTKNISIKNFMLSMKKTVSKEDLPKIKLEL